ncbi:hypothetical protein ANCDUO_15188 [Ancylostoma duodenale]|uniref:Uncharacterized protein n=1 Tax=Ancylostoma duodenale TaxID=51022 RepID=A0A0C2G143_9BILA|nr:hypothetical protein ANCDUO_15188 [Ancylostoma duodenale]
MNKNDGFNTNQAYIECTEASPKLLFVIAKASSEFRRGMDNGDPGARVYSLFILQTTSMILYIDRSKDMLEYVALDRHVGFGALPYDTDQYPIVVFDRKRSVLFVTDVDIAPEYLAFALNKNMTGLRESFNKAIAISSDGLDNIRNRYAIPYEQYDENPREKEHIILKFAHIRRRFFTSFDMNSVHFFADFATHYGSEHQ